MAITMCAMRRVISETLPMGEPLPPGYVELDVVLEKSTATGQVVNTWLQCESEPTPTTLPPPTPEESWAAADTLLPLPTIQFSPSDNGLVHLQTWFWLSNDAAGTPVTVTARTHTGQTITAVVEPVGYTWTFGTGDSAPSSTAGSEEDPAVRYTYVDAGTYEVSVTVEWAGQYLRPWRRRRGRFGTGSGSGYLCPLPSETNPLGPQRRYRMSNRNRGSRTSLWRVSGVAPGGSATCPMPATSYRSPLAG